MILPVCAKRCAGIHPCSFRTLYSRCFIVCTWPNITSNAGLHSVKLFERSHTKLIAQVANLAGRCPWFHVRASTRTVIVRGQSWRTPRSGFQPKYSPCEREKTARNDGTPHPRLAACCGRMPCAVGDANDSPFGTDRLILSAPSPCTHVPYESLATTVR